MVRVEPEEGERLLAAGKAHPFEMRGRDLAGWLRVDAEAVRTRRDLVRWIKTASTFVRSLPPKKAKARRSSASR